MLVDRVNKSLASPFASQAARLRPGNDIAGSVYWLRTGLNYFPRRWWILAIANTHFFFCPCERAPPPQVGENTGNLTWHASTSFLSRYLAADGKTRYLSDLAPANDAASRSAATTRAAGCAKNLRGENFTAIVPHVVLTFVARLWECKGRRIFHIMTSRCNFLHCTEVNSRANQ